MNAWGLVAPLMVIALAWAGVGLAQEKTPAPPTRKTPAPPASKTPAPLVSKTPAPPASKTPAPPASKTPAPPVKERRPAEPCPPTPGVLPSEDQARGACLFRNTRVFGQDPQGPFAACASCHYGSEATDEGVHLVQILRGGVEQTQVLRKTPSLLKARVNFPYGADGRFSTVQEAARAAILSPLEMGGTTVTEAQLDALAAYVVSLGEPDHTAPPAPEPSPGTLQRIAVGKEVFFGQGQCVNCHPAPEFTTHAITTNQIRRSFTGPTDRGAAVVGTGGPSEFKVPSLLFFGAGQPFMHNGSLPKVEQMVRFYNESFDLGLTEPQLTGLRYWLQNCLNPRRTPQPSTC